MVVCRALSGVLERVLFDPLGRGLARRLWHALAGGAGAAQGRRRESIPRSALGTYDGMAWRMAASGYSVTLVVVKISGDAKTNRTVANDGDAFSAAYVNTSIVLADYCASAQIMRP